MVGGIISIRYDCFVLVLNKNRNINSKILLYFLRTILPNNTVFLLLGYKLQNI